MNKSWFRTGIKTDSEMVLNIRAVRQTEREYTNVLPLRFNHAHQEPHIGFSDVPTLVFVDVYRFNRNITNLTDCGEDFTPELPIKLERLGFHRTCAHRLNGRSHLLAMCSVVTASTEDGLVAH